MNFEAGSRFLYSNTNFWLLGKIIEKLSRLSLAEFLEDRIFGPLGMTRTRHTPDVMVPVEGLATGYLPRGTGFVRAGHGFPLGGEGGLVSGIEDLALWGRALSLNLLSGGVVEAQLQELLPFTNGSLSTYARGLEVEEWRGLKLVSHGGLWPGFKTAFLRVPARRLTVLLATNNGGLDAHAMGMAVMEAALEGDAVLHAVAAMPKLDALDGTFTTADGATLDLWRDEHGKPMARQHGVAFPLGARADGMLHALRPGFRFAIERGAAGLVLHTDAGHKAALLPVAAPRQALAVEGVFHCADVGATWRVDADGWRAEGPHAKSEANRAEGLTADLARFHMAGALYDSWWDVRLIRDAAGAVSALEANGARARGLRFERV